VHPRRELEGALDTIRGWVEREGVRIGQVPVPGQPRQVAEPVEPGNCDLVIAVGGDGTTLAGLHAAAPLGRPVLGVACGSIGALTSLHVGQLAAGLEEISQGRWAPVALPGLEIAAGGERHVALNDFAAVRAGIGQVISSIRVDGELYARTAGDGVIVATQLGSSAYTMAAGGPILSPGAFAMVVTPLAPHGGVAPPLVVGAESRVQLEIEPGYGGARFEVDGQVMTSPVEHVDLVYRADYATLVVVGEAEPMLTGLRRRGLIVDGPRLLARDARDEPPAGG
jgi:NAD+ kinase